MSSGHGWQSIFAKNVLVLCFSNLSYWTVVKCRIVCKVWKKACDDELLWKTLLCRKFPFFAVPSCARVGSYRFLFMKRIVALKNTSEIVIENCDEQISTGSCKFLWSSLEKDEGGEKYKRKCQICLKNVFLVKTEEEFKRRTEKDEKVAIAPKYIREDRNIDHTYKPGTYSDATLIMQLLRDNLTKWFQVFPQSFDLHVLFFRCDDEEEDEEEEDEEKELKEDKRDEDNAKSPDAKQKIQLLHDHINQWYFLFVFFCVLFNYVSRSFKKSNESEEGENAHYKSE